MIEIDFSFSGGLAGMDNAANAIITLGVLGPQPLEQTSGDPREQSLFTGCQPPHHPPPGKHPYWADRPLNPAPLLTEHL